MANDQPINETHELERVIRQLQGEPWLVCDLVRSENDKNRDSIMGWTLAGPTFLDVLFIPTDHASNSEKNKQFPSQPPMEKIQELITGRPLVGYDLVPVILFMEQLKWELPLLWKSDVMVEAFITGRYPNVELSYLVETLYGAKLTGIDGLYPEASQKGKRQNTLRFEEIPLEALSQIAGERAHYIRRIHQDFFNEIENDARLKRLHQMEMDILPIAAEMQKVGIRIDSAKCQSEYERLTKEAEVLSKSLHCWLRRNFNISDQFDFGSSPQTADLLIDRLHILKEVKTEKGNRSTSKKIYEGMRDCSPIVNAIYTYRELIKICSGFYGLYPKFQGSDGRLHPKLLTTHVISGRTASADPNCQQIPKESVWEFIDFEDPSSDGCATCPAGGCPACQIVKKKTLRTAVREVFLPRDGYLYVEADYSQIELMVLAGVAGEPMMLEAFRKGLDIHSHTASLIYSVPLNEVNKVQRNVGKRTNYRFNYGGGPKGLADQLGIPLKQAYEINRAYSRAYPLIDSFAEDPPVTPLRMGMLKLSLDAADTWRNSAPPIQRQGLEGGGFQSICKFKEERQTLPRSD